ncbi:MAG: glycine betaine/L-proline ABC transporter ATP-binding protein, partial [Glaciimonas sp.]|nr:glycine betaine/L-proline ABC transporter ATP-binding protein [Glaciimonas sp.]
VMQPIVMKGVETIGHRTTLDAVMDKLIVSTMPLPVVDADGCYCGAISQAMVLQAISKSRGSHA